MRLPAKAEGRSPGRFLRIPPWSGRRLEKQPRRCGRRLTRWSANHRRRHHAGAGRGQRGSTGGDRGGPWVNPGGRIEHDPSPRLDRIAISLTARRRYGSTRFRGWEHNHARGDERRETEPYAALFTRRTRCSAALTARGLFRRSGRVSRLDGLFHQSPVHDADRVRDQPVSYDFSQRPRRSVGIDCRPEERREYRPANCPNSGAGAKRRDWRGINGLR